MVCFYFKRHEFSNYRNAKHVKVGVKRSSIHLVSNTQRAKLLDTTTHLQGVMKSMSLCWVSCMMTRVSLEMAMKASIWVLVLQSSTTTAQDSAPLSEASGENLGRRDNFFFGANNAESIIFLGMFFLNPYYFFMEIIHWTCYWILVDKLHYLINGMRQTLHFSILNVLS